MGIANVRKESVPGFSHGSGESVGCSIPFCSSVTLLQIQRFCTVLLSTTIQ